MAVRPRIKWKFRSGISTVIKGMSAATRTQLVEVAKVLRDEMKEKVGGKGGGRTYTHAFWYSGPFPTGKLMKGKRLGSPITASAPGQPPAKQTGALYDSIRVDLGTDASGKRAQGVKKSGMFKLRVGTNLKYGRWLEFDWRQANGRVRAARPWAMPATRTAKSKMKAEWKNLRGVLKARLKGTLSMDQTPQKEADKNVI